MTRDRVLVITPTFQELANLRTLLPVFRAAQPDADLLVIDDASDDGTPEWVRAQPGFGQNLFLLERPGKLGLGTAYRLGFAWALERDYGFIFEMDADLSHDPSELAVMRAKLEGEADVVVGSRYLDGVRVLNWPISRLLLSLFAAQYVRVLTALPSTDPTSGFKGFRRAVLEGIDLAAVKSSGYSFQIEMSFRAWRKGFRLAEVPIVFADRRAGTSKMSPHIAREAVVEVARMGLEKLIGLGVRSIRPSRRPARAAIPQSTAV